MTPELTLKLKADTAQVVAGIRDVVAGFDRLKAEGRLTAGDVRLLQQAMREVGTASREGIGAAGTAMKGLATDANAAAGAFEAAGNRARVVADHTAAAAGGLNQVSVMSGSARAGLQNFSYQIQDIAVQLQMGTDKSIIFAQQGPQILSAFGPAGALLGTLAAVTLPLLVYAFSETEEAAKKTAKQVEEIIARTRELQVSVDALSLGVDEVEVKTVQELNAAIAERARVEQELRALYANGPSLSEDAAAEAIALNQQLSILNEKVRVAQANMDAYRQTRDEAERLAGAQERTRAIAQRFLQDVLDTQTAMMQIASMNISGPFQGALKYAVSLRKVAQDIAGVFAAAGKTAFTKATTGPAFERGGRTGSSAGPDIPDVPTLDDLIDAGGGGGGGGGGRSEGVPGLREDASKALAQLSVAIATINEKVRAGIMSAGEAAKGVEQANARAGNSLAEIIAKMEAMGPAGKAAAAELRPALDDLGDKLGETGKAAESVGSGISSALASMATGAKSAGEAFEDMGETILSTIARIMSQRFTDSFIMPLVNSIFSVAGFANGGVIGSIKEASNTVVDRPTLFPFAGGVGLMGEAGAEAIMPLSGGGIMTDAGRILPLGRNASGRLIARTMGNVRAFADGGVIGSASGGGGGGAPNIVINNQGAPMKVQDMRQEGNTTFLTVMNERMMNAAAADIQRGGPVAQAMESAYGLRRAPR